MQAKQYNDEYQSPKHVTIQNSIMMRATLKQCKQTKQYNDKDHSLNNASRLNNIMTRQFSGQKKYFRIQYDNKTRHL